MGDERRKKKFLQGPEYKELWQMVSPDPYFRKQLKGTIMSYER